MFQRYSAIVISAFAISALTWWSNPSPISKPTLRADVLINGKAEFSELSPDRQELIETLKQLILAQHRYRATHGSFTRILTKLDYAVPRHAAQRFGFSVEDMSSDAVTISGYSETEGRTTDVVSLNHDFKLRTSFQMREAHALKIREQGRRYVAELSSMEKQDRRIALLDDHPERKVLADLIKRMPSQSAIRPGQREEGLELVIEPVERID